MERFCGGEGGAVKVSHMKCHRLHAKNDSDSEESKKKTKSFTCRWCFFFSVFFWLPLFLVSGLQQFIPIRETSVHSPLESGGNVDKNQNTT